VTGPGVLAYQNDPSLRSISDDPTERAAMFLRAYKVGWFYKAESKISGDIANLGVSVAHEDEGGENEATVIEPDLFTPWERLDPIGQFLRLMERPNPYQTGRQLRQKTMIRTDMAGWTHWYMEGAGPIGSGVLPTGIYGISPTRLTPSFDKTSGTLLGWVLDADGRGGGVPFSKDEILTFVYPSADDSWAGVGVVEPVYAELPLGAQIAKHTSDLLSTGGRLAGMLWPKERALDEAEFLDAQRAWRNVSTDSNAAKRLLLFPEPMEYAAGASTPAEIGIPELAELNRDNILSAFPISPYQLGVPMPGGLNSAETRREDRRDYWESTIHPRVELLEETIQVGMLALYESVLGTTYDFDIMEPNLDDAVSLIAKAQAMADLVAQGFTEESAIKALQLDGLQWVKPAPMPIPVITTPEEPLPPEPVPVVKAAIKSAPEDARDKVTEPATTTARGLLEAFFAAQRDRTAARMRETLPASKAERTKAQPTWWDAEFEDEELTKVMRGIYATVGRGALQEVADTIGRFVFKGATQTVIADLLTVGGERVKDINARTLQALTVELAEGTRRGYSIPQLIEGVASEGYHGVLGVTLDNGTPAFGDLRAETIARTETMLSYNRATVTGYGEFGVTHLLAYDGDDDEACANRNGQEFTIEEASGIDDHPNGTLVWSPVVDKAWHEPQPDPTIVALLETVKALIERPAPTAPNVYITNQPPDVNVAGPDVHIAPPAVTVEPAQVTVEGANVQVDVHVPETLPPIVNVEPPQVDIHVPESAAPVVNVHVPEAPEAKAAIIHVNVPEAKAPIVNNYVEAKAAPAAVDVHILSEPKRTRKVVKRDAQGRIQAVEEE
jgi:hypothetical protein